MFNILINREELKAYFISAELAQGCMHPCTMHKWDLASSAKCECGASEQTADHITLTCPTHRAPRGIMGLTVLDDEKR